jgi:hypothetical protein
MDIQYGIPRYSKLDSGEVDDSLVLCLYAYGYEFITGIGPFQVLVDDEDTLSMLSIGLHPNIPHRPQYLGGSWGGRQSSNTIENLVNIEDRACICGRTCMIPDQMTAKVALYYTIRLAYPVGTVWPDVPDGDHAVL